MAPRQETIEEPKKTTLSQPWKQWFEPGKDAVKVPLGPTKAVELYDNQQNGQGPIDIIATEFEWQ